MNTSYSEHAKNNVQVLKTDNPVNDLPCAVIRSNTFFLLDGQWQFSLDLADKGMREGWYVEHTS